MIRAPKRAVIILIIASFFFQGCATLPFKYDFKDIFSDYTSKVNYNPIIIIPGITGSRLMDTQTGKTFWGSLRAKEVFFLSEREDIALPFDKLPLSENRDTVVSKGIIDKYELPMGIIQFKVYKDIIDMLEGVGYKLGDIRNPKPDDNLYIFDYDWRRDNVETAKSLSDTIETIKKKTGRPNQRFTLVCHSMGGLVGRYYMRYGGHDVLKQNSNFRVTYEGARNIKRLILIGSPNLGSMPVFQFLHRGLDLAIVKYPPTVLFTMPSIYQILPFRELKSFVDEHGNNVDVDLYDLENWKKYGWSIYSEKMVTFVRSRYRHKYKDKWKQEVEKFEKERDKFVEAALLRADLFQKSLNFRPNTEPNCEIILFGGDTEWTLNKAILNEGKKGQWHTYFWDPRIKKKILVPGDSMVTRESLLGVPSAKITKSSWLESPMHISFSLFVTQRHENIHKDATFQDNLLHILLEN